VPGLQVVVTTHSPHFVDLAWPENLVLVSKAEGEATKVVQRSREELRAELVGRGANVERSRVDTIGSFCAASATEIVSGLFARCCVLVEGPTEALALPALLFARGLDVLREGVAVVPVEGVGNVAKWHRLYTALGIRCFCVFDTDSDKQGKDAADLVVKRRDIMAALGLDESRAGAENLAPDPLAVQDAYATLNPNSRKPPPRSSGKGGPACMSTPYPWSETPSLSGRTTRLSASNPPTSRAAPRQLSTLWSARSAASRTRTRTETRRKTPGEPQPRWTRGIGPPHATRRRTPGRLPTGFAKDDWRQRGRSGAALLIDE